MVFPAERTQNPFVLQQLTLCQTLIFANCFWSTTETRGLYKNNNVDFSKAVEEKRKRRETNEYVVTDTRQHDPTLNVNLPPTK